MLFWCDGIFLRQLQDFQRLDADFKTGGKAGRSVIGAHNSADDDGRFLRQRAGGFELVRRHVFLEGDALRLPAAVAQQDELQAALAGLVVDPAPQGDNLPLVCRDILDLNEFRHR